MIVIHRIVRAMGERPSKGCTNRVECSCRPVQIRDGEKVIWVHQPEWYISVMNDSRVVKALEERNANVD